jgi:prevent-host-death family protein
MAVVKQLTITQAKAQLSTLLDQLAPGEEIIITKRGKPRAKLVGLPRDP